QALSQLSYTPLQNRNAILEGFSQLVNTPFPNPQNFLRNIGKLGHRRRAATSAAPRAAPFSLVDHALMR
ncbi:hypothetical protein, partial [Burkholderia glumae]